MNNTQIAYHIVLDCGVLIILAMLAWTATIRIRRWFMRNDDSPFETGFSLEQLDRMFKRGELTEAEFRNIKRKRALRAARYLGKIGPSGADSQTPPASPPDSNPDDPQPPPLPK